jgi:phenylacetyl-CoA:acceptor oxidoreductase subunit 1
MTETPAHSGSEPRWGMVVDLNRCVGCQTCTIACKHANDTPPGVQWRRVLDVERGTFPNVERLFLVTGCQHCAEPPCVPVCPTGATAQRADGLVTMDYDTCIGCGYCAVACPYQARTIVHDKSWYYGEPTAQEQKVRHDDRYGVANKCTFCIERIDEAAESGLTPGVDLSHTPACVASCIAGALHFGDYANADSNVSRLTRDNANFQMHAELGTDPQIKYLYDVPDATPGRDPAPEDTDDSVLGRPEDPLVGERQRFWDMRAAMNFTLGGMSSGLAIVALIVHLYARSNDSWLFIGQGESGLLLIYLLAGGGMAVGLFFVFLEIGRKLRFLKVLARPQTSWMTRETYAVALFYPALLADLFWPSMALHVVVALAAAAFLYSQGRILYAGRGIPAWRVDAMPAMLVATGLFEGAGWLAVAAALLRGDAATGTAVAFLLVVLAVENARRWYVYCRDARANGIAPLARREIARITPALHLIGHAAPLVLGIVALTGGPSWALAIAGLAAVAGGALWKIVVITRACHQQGFALPKMPRRGSGTRAAPARLGGL